MSKYESILTFGHFSTIHPGHIRYLKKAREYGKLVRTLIVGDKLNNEKYPYSEEERMEGINLINLSDSIQIVNFEKDIVEYIKINKVKSALLGEEYKSTADKEKKRIVDVLEENKVDIYFHNDDNLETSESLLGKNLIEVNNERTFTFRKVCNMNMISKQSLLSLIDEFENTRIMVIGDIILDEYIDCEAIGMSAEAPVLVVREKGKEQFVGGAGIVGEHIKAIGGNHKLITVSGRDSESEWIANKVGLETSEIVVDDERPTTKKIRYVADNQKLLRVSRLSQSDISKEVEEKIIKKLNKEEKWYKSIVISDFGYGLCTKRIIKTCIAISKRNEIPILGDAQSSSQTNDVKKFNGFDLICPNLREARLALADNTSTIEQIGQKMITTTNAKAMLLKLAGEGLILYWRKDQKLRSTHFPALSAFPVDVAGAGDSMLAIMSMAICKGRILEGAALASIMAGICVEQVGNKPIKKEVLIEAVKRQLS